MGFYCKQAVQRWLIHQGQSGQIKYYQKIIIIDNYFVHMALLNKPLLDSLFTVKPHD